VCECERAGTDESVCDMETGECQCKTGYDGDDCGQCDALHFGYPNCERMPFLSLSSTESTACACDASGAPNATTCKRGDPSTSAEAGQCPCLENYATKQCSACKTGFYAFPECAECACFAAGAKGDSCTEQAQCYCRDNFVGLKCEQCKTNFFNFPLCEGA